MGAFLITVVREVKKLSCSFLLNSVPHPFSLKKLFFCKKKFLALYTVDKRLCLVFGEEKIIDSWSFLFLLTHIGLNLPDDGESVRQWPGRPGFNPRSSHTKDSKNGI